MSNVKQENGNQNNLEGMGESMRKLEDDFDLDNMTCEKHPRKVWPHKVWFFWLCAGPGIPRRKES